MIALARGQREPTSPRVYGEVGSCGTNRRSCCITATMPTAVIMSRLTLPVTCRELIVLAYGLFYRGINLVRVADSGRRQRSAILSNCQIAADLKRLRA